MLGSLEERQAWLQGEEGVPAQHPQRQRGQQCSLSWQRHLHPVNNPIAPHSNPEREASQCGEERRAGAGVPGGTQRWSG